MINSSSHNDNSFHSSHWFLCLKCIYYCDRRISFQENNFNSSWKDYSVPNRQKQKCNIVLGLMLTIKCFYDMYARFCDQQLRVWLKYNSRKISDKTVHYLHSEKKNLIFQIVMIVFEWQNFHISKKSNSFSSQENEHNLEFPYLPSVTFPP